MNKQAKRYSENHFRFSDKPDSDSVEISLDFRPMPSHDPVYVVPERPIGFSDVPKHDLSLGHGHDIEAGVHFYQDDYRFNGFVNHPETYFPYLKTIIVFLPRTVLSFGIWK
ncbi:MAG: hypothetical protein PHQ75_13120 [Thermoguttaceae bacterium]|nr:hypothetical protein [Thermoguttaceae bacterium]